MDNIDKFTRREQLMRDYEEHLKAASSQFKMTHKSPKLSYNEQMYVISRWLFQLLANHKAGERPKY